MKKENTRSDIIQVLYACLDEIPFLQYELSDINQCSNQKIPDLDIKLFWKEGRKTRKYQLICLFKNNLQPRLARLAIHELQSLMLNRPDTYPVLMAPYLSKASMDICRQANVGYIDLQGNCCLSFEQIYILKLSKIPSEGEKRDLRTLYSPKAERILRVLLNDPQHRWLIKDLADTADVSTGLVSNVKKLLVDQDWMNGKEIRLLSPLQLLEGWRAAYKPGRSLKKQYYSRDQIPVIETQLADICQKLGLQYAFTGFAAAIRRAPFVKYQNVAAYIEGDTETLVKEINAKEVNSGGNITIIEPYDKGVFYGGNEYEGYLLVSAIQNYLDLVVLPNRGPEAAEFLLEEVIKPQWSNE